MKISKKCGLDLFIRKYKSKLREGKRSGYQKISFSLAGFENFLNDLSEIAQKMDGVKTSSPITKRRTQKRRRDGFKNFFKGLPQIIFSLGFLYLLYWLLSQYGRG